MNIKTASEKTGLTKKAIKYYENEGLITPLKKCENNYREYSNDDIVKLNLIGALRALDITIVDIKDVVMGRRSLPETLLDTVKKIDESITYLGKSKLIITSLIEKNLTDYRASGEQIRRLRETLELSRDDKKEFISNTLLIIFPGKFGQLFVSIYAHFLSVTIDNDEKKKIWLKLVDFLDSVDEVVYKNTFLIKQINDSDNDNLDGLKKALDTQCKYILDYDANTKDNIMINRQIELARSLKESEELKQKFNKGLEDLKQFMKVVGPIQKGFEEYLCILNEDYKKYKDNEIKMLANVNKMVKDKLGFTANEFIKHCTL
ncbi:MerR family transcriptional regulator [Clostridium estertheticum]|uniref:MerR family transcriptional regulator n=1 Tax=Clostridium estertheticum TaxID=238834 RepID=A0AA47EJT2_9CLOT|nr:MerR family transcriptional regulator [Clostridium estertheticum]MBU3153687.1 MerR family transcriptional regulator [Clostridium estertheticum]MBU3200172.1 MerR family transcriptional regulator [Clostridium estertheticum]WAG61527.1 MerR family transcriptional regulator [Clostridium estertheticum]WAG64345.1 MerR family transcriptional regulator [Clostridium estertheticum]